VIEVRTRSSWCKLAPLEQAGATLEKLAFEVQRIQRHRDE